MLVFQWVLLLRNRLISFARKYQSPEAIILLYLFLCKMRSHFNYITTQSGYHTRNFELQFYNFFSSQTPPPLL